MTTRLSISAPNSLLVITGAGATSTPIPDGTSTVVASDDTIFVMTRYSDLGPTNVAVAIEPDGTWPSPGLRQVFEGAIRSPGGIIELLNVHVESYGKFHVGSDSARVRVAIDREIEPNRIELAFDPGLTRGRSQVNNATSTTSSQERTDRVEADGCITDTETLAGD